MVDEQEVMYTKAVEAAKTDDPNVMYADVMREEKVTNILSQINPDNLMVDVEHRIRGEKKDPYLQKWVKINKNKEPVSDELVADAMGFLGSILNQNTSLSNFSAREINAMMEMIIEQIKDSLTVKAKVYGIEGDYTEMTRIGNILCITIFTTFKQAMNGMLARRIFHSLRVHGTLDAQDNKKGALDFMKFWS